MRPSRRSLQWIAVLAPVILALATTDTAFAEGITRVRGKIVDNHGKPLAKVPIMFEAVDINKKVGPVRTGKDGDFIIATLDVTVAKKWHVIPQLPGYKTVKVSWEIVNSSKEEVGKDARILGSKQEYPELQFVLVGDEGRNVVDFVLAKDAEFIAAVQEERKLKEGGAAGAAGAPAAGAPAATAGAAPAAPAAADPVRVPGGAESLKKAKELTDAGRHAEAIELYRGFLAKDPTGNPAAYYYLGKSLFESGDDGGAEQAFKKGLELQAGMKGAHFYLGNIYLKEDRAAEAAAEYEKEAEISPDLDAVFFNLGQAYDKTGDEDKALAAFEKAVTINPQKSEALMQMASIYEKKKDTAKAEEMYQKVIAIDPKNASISFFNIGAHARNENRNKEAVQAFRKAIEIDPTYAVAHRELGYALMGTQDFAGALKQFQEYIRLNPRAPDAKQIQDTIALLKQ